MAMSNAHKIRPDGFEGLSRVHHTVFVRCGVSHRTLVTQVRQFLVTESASARSHIYRSILSNVHTLTQGIKVGGAIAYI